MIALLVKEILKSKKYIVMNVYSTEILRKEPLNDSLFWRLDLFSRII